MRRLLLAIFVLLPLVPACSAGGIQPTPSPVSLPTATPAAPSPAAGPGSAAEMQRFEHPELSLPKAGPGGTAWDRQYRSLIQTDADAASKGLPSHAQATQEILTDAASNSTQLELHKAYVLYIKHYSQAYRPEAATADLLRLYTGLVNLQYGAPVAAAPAASALPFAGDSRLTIYRDVVYGTQDPAMQTLDAYLVKSGVPGPVLIEIHGGGWRRGEKSQFEGVYAGGLIDRILAAGISVVSINYRLTGKYPYPAQAEDAARAVQFVRAKAGEWNIDGRRVAALGGSAGAHLAAWLALHDDLADPAASDTIRRQSTRLQAFVDMWGPMDLTRVNPMQLSRESLRGEDFSQAFVDLFDTTLEGYNTTADGKALIRAASPLFYVSPDDPPAFIMHAASAEQALVDHPPVPAIINDPHSPWFGVLLADAMQGAGIEHVRYIGPEVGKDPARDNEAILAFLTKHLAPDTR